MTFDKGMIVDTPLGRGKIAQLKRSEYFVQIGPEGFARGGGEWFAESELASVLDESFPTSNDFIEDYQGL